MATRICEMEESQRPRERLIASGPETLSDAELVAVLLRTGRKGNGVLSLAHELLLEAGGLVELSRLDLAELIPRSGMGKAKAATLSAALELGRRLAEARLRQAVTLDQPETAGRFLAGYLQRQSREIVGFLSLDARCRLLRINNLSLGTRRNAPVDPSDLFRRALLDGASSVLVFHNHPSGDLSPSGEDLELTERLVRSGSLLGVPVSDHLIIAGSDWSSLRRSYPSLFRVRSRS